MSAKDGYYEMTDDCRYAKRISIGGCEGGGCTCGAIYIRLHDEQNRVFAIAPLDCDVAVTVTGQVTDEIERVRSLGRSVN